MISDSYGIITMNPGNYAGNSYSFPSSGNETELTGLATSFVISPLSVDFDQPSDGRLRYIGSQTRTFLASIKYFAEEGRLGIALRKNGLVIGSGDHSTCVQEDGNQPGIFNVIVDLSQNDYISIFAMRQVSGTRNVYNASISAFSIEDVT